MKKVGNGPYDRSQNMGPNCGIFGDFWAVRDSPETDVGCYVGIYALSYVLLFIRPKMGKKFGSKK